MGVGRVTFSYLGAHERSLCLNMAKHRSFDIFFFFFFFFFTISGDPTSYFIEMSMLISLKGTLSQTGMWIGRVSLSSEGPMRGQNVF